MPFGVAVDMVLVYLEEALDFSLQAGIGETVTVIAFVPLATAIILQAKANFHNRYIRKSTATAPEPEVSIKQRKRQLTGKSMASLPVSEKLV